MENALGIRTYVMSQEEDSLLKKNTIIAVIVLIMRNAKHIKEGKMVSVNRVCKKICKFMMLLEPG